MSESMRISALWASGALVLLDLSLPGRVGVWGHRCK